MKGEKESIRNLLEIFDGLLEYLTEESSENTSQNGGKYRVNSTCLFSGNTAKITKIENTILSPLASTLARDVANMM